MFGQYILWNCIEKGSGAHMKKNPSILAHPSTYDIGTMSILTNIVKKKCQGTLSRFSTGEFGMSLKTQIGHANRMHDLKLCVVADFIYISFAL